MQFSVHQGCSQPSGKVQTVSDLSLHSVCADLAINYMDLLLLSAKGVQITLNLEWLQQYKPNMVNLESAPVCVCVFTVDFYKLKRDGT